MSPSLYSRGLRRLSAGVVLGAAVVAMHLTVEGQFGTMRSPVDHALVFATAVADEAPDGHECPPGCTR